MLFRRRMPHDPAAARLEVADIEVRLESTPVLEEVRFRVEAGERLAVVGPNGAGKSTLFRAIAGILPPARGRISVGGSQPGLHVCIAYLAQRSDVNWQFPLTVEDAVLMGRIRRIGLFHATGRHDRAIAARCLETVGLAPLARRRISDLSGGQQQRMFIARALAQEAEIMLMDEPFNGLDAPAQEAIFAILDRLRSQGVAILVALHDLNLAAARFDRVLLLNRRQIACDAPADALSTRHLEAAYGDRLRLIASPAGPRALVDTCCQGGGSCPNS